ncbi:MAG: hemerythrin domain-containing protein [Betaproteobacteria bacterium]|nr:MAG: hemerythrin domain-containing protein [Betaproteobacteria bacterium]
MIDKPVAPSFDEPLEMLAACHERIEHQLATLERMVPHLEKRGCDAEARSAAQAVLRYFETAGVLHHRDEDEDLFPLLRTLAATHSRPEVAAALDELEREHETMHAQWERLRKRLQAVERGEPRLDPEEVARFAWLYRRHMDREGAAVLPFAREALDADQRAALGDRMAARRKISLPPKGANTK